MNKTLVSCEMTGCKFNSSCCRTPHDSQGMYCTKENIKIYVDEDSNSLECNGFEEIENYNDKVVECNSCQFKKYGAVKLKANNNISFTEVK